MKMRITTSHAPGMIVQTVTSVSNEHRHLGPMASRVLDLMDEGVRQALMYEGWRPPA